MRPGVPGSAVTRPAGSLCWRGGQLRPGGLALRLNGRRPGGTGAGIQRSVDGERPVNYLLLAAPQQQVRWVLTLTRLIDVFPVHASVGEAAGSAGSPRREARCRLEVPSSSP
jgi:hypothetical protein